MVTSTDGLAVDLHDVDKTYKRKVHALRGIEMQVHAGEIFGLLGPNGAGKSTLVKVMMTVIHANKARGTILGKPVGHKPTLGKIGYLPEHHLFPPYFTGREALEYYGALSGISRPVRKARALELLAMVDLQDWGRAKVGTYSKGMQQRLGLAQAFMNDPDLVLLDEPTDGLDPLGRRDIREVLKRFREQGKTIFVNSHLLGEVELVCDRLAILVAGKVVRQGRAGELTSQKQFHEIAMHAAANVDLADAIRAALPCEMTKVRRIGPPPLPSSGYSPPPADETGKLSSGHRVEIAGNTVRVHTGEAADIQAIIDALRAQKLVIASVGVIRQSLEDFFVETVSDVRSTSAAAAGQGGAV